MTTSPALSATLPGTDYFEISSDLVGDTFGIWVTRPAGHEEGGPALPVVYTTDGNASAALLAPLQGLLVYDLLESWRPFVHVAVGYPPESAGGWVTTRTRDLVPPGERPSETVIADVRKDAEAAGWSAEEEAGYLAAILDGGRADRFLAFLSEELRPEIGRRYRVSEQDTGLFGFSYGGLFSLYALTQRRAMFQNIGAGSPGVMHAESTIFEALRADRTPYDDVRCHVTVTDKEFVGRSQTFRELAVHTAALINEVLTDQPDGLDFTARILAGETHASGLTQSYLDFLRACHPAEAETGGSAGG